MEWQSFAQQLIAARKAAGLTQEQLGERMHMSRQGISHWETGRALPDAEMVRQLSQVLNYDFVTSQALSEAQAPVTEVPAAPGRPVWRQPVMWLSVAVVLLTAAVVVLLLRPAGTTGGLVTPPAANVAVPAGDAVRAEVRIIPAQSPLTPTLDVVLGPTPWWIYRLTLQETAGVDFMVEKASVILTYEDGRVKVAEYSGEYFAASIGLGSNVLHAGSNVQWNGAEPLLELASITVRLDGTDALGNVLRFERVMECRRPETTQTPADGGGLR